MLKHLLNSQRFRSLSAGGFFLFICWIIYTADQGQAPPCLQHVRAIPYGDKIGHFTLFGLLAFMVNLALNNKRIELGDQSLLLGSVLITVFAIAEEFTQLAFVTREFEIVDMICDVLGIALFSRLSVRINRRLQPGEAYSKS